VLYTDPYELRSRLKSCPQERVESSSEDSVSPDDRQKHEVDRRVGRNCDQDDVQTLSTGQTNNRECSLAMKTISMDRSSQSSQAMHTHHPCAFLYVRGGEVLSYMFVQLLCKSSPGSLPHLRVFKTRSSWSSAQWLTRKVLVISID
jgi:hypothetical protein